jgi:HD-GYP domain-containing protein (c-di-GMP phosphodiesterase class II)
MGGSLSLRDALAGGISPGAAELLTRMNTRGLVHHGIGVARWVIATCRTVELDETQTAAFARAAIFHDAGKLEIPARVLDRRGPLPRTAWHVVRSHPVRGERLVSEVPELADVAPIVRHHHERWDGAGYPDGLAGEDIPLGARVVFACDAFVAMTEFRCYRPTLDTEQALDEVRAGAGTQFDPIVAAALGDTIASFERFTSGREGGR